MTAISQCEAKKTISPGATSSELGEFAENIISLIITDSGSARILSHFLFNLSTEVIIKSFKLAILLDPCINYSMTAISQCEAKKTISPGATSSELGEFAENIISLIITDSGSARILSHFVQQ
ncbi:hypothetical protein Glove_295g53 [Diversispora epigaea]|uniref:Uncharacterized protein n=1 Tax=Diversispora epigaea TaxID=1348612 RepID=A0A397HYP3_9GLOM|nr:hypothetical protein Glove_295g53 [Diversispora epigaea]